MRRSRQLKPLSSEHHQALLVALQLKRGLAGHGESAGAPRDLPGLVALARRFDERVFRPHTQAEEELLGKHLPAADFHRLTAEHAELKAHVEAALRVEPAEQRIALGRFAEKLELHVRWEEREVFPYAEEHLGDEALAIIGGELEKRLVLAGSSQGRRQSR